MGPIPWDKIVEYADFVGLEKDMARVFVLTIRSMDSIYLDWVDKKRDRDKPKVPRKVGKSKAGRRR